MNVVAEDVKKGLMEEILYADYLLLMGETIEDIGRKFYKWKNALKMKLN